MKKFTLRLLLIIACLGLSAVTIYGQESSTLPPYQTFALNSSIMHDDYQVYVLLPPGYEESPERHYETVYFLDANWTAEGARRIMESLLQRHEIQPLVLVGVCPIQAFDNGYDGTCPIRCRDLTPTQVKRYPGSGTAGDFARFLKDELVPYIDQHYQTIPNPNNRCLVGHSFGGLFSFYMLFNQQDVFKKYMIFSPSIWWNRRYILKNEAEYAKNNKALNATVYTTVGGYELFMRPNQRRMIRRLEKDHYEGLVICSEIIKGAKHITVWNPSFERGLLRFYKTN